MGKFRNVAKQRGVAENSNFIAAPKPPEKGTATAAVPKAFKTIAERLEKDQKFMADMLGLDEPELAVALTRQAKRLVAAFGADDSELEITMSMLFEQKPKNLSQTLLAVQTTGVHCAAMLYLKRAALFAMRNMNFEAADANMKTAMELMRLFIDQLETMAKLSGKTRQQKVTVEHVHVNDGGQAIVGAVTAPANRAKQEERNENQSSTPSKPPRLAEKRKSCR